MTIYIVSGWLRSGTSMMMRALNEGGIPAVSSEVRERNARMRFDSDGYVGNAGGYFELTPEELYAPDFPLPYEGKVVKSLRYDVLSITAYTPGYKIIYMRRDPEEIRQSAQALMRVSMSSKAAEMIAMATQRIMEILMQRQDVSLLEVQYADVVAKPLEEFERIAAAGWPIDAAKAAAIVDDKLYRFRRSLLQVGA